MPELCVLVFEVAVCIRVYTTYFSWHLLLFTMGMNGKQERMQHYTVVVCLKWNFGPSSNVIQMVSCFSSMLLLS